MVAHLVRPQQARLYSQALEKEGVGVFWSNQGPVGLTKRFLPAKLEAEAVQWSWARPASFQEAA